MVVSEIESRFASKAPFPWFGGKSQAAPLVWSLLGDVDHYCEPFAGSLAVLLGRPHLCNRSYYSETVNDLDGFICNAWRAIAWSPQETAVAASWPVSEADKSARQIALLRWRDEVALERLAGDPRWHDPVMAGWWLWAVAVQIGAFVGDGAWTADRRTGRIYKQGRGQREPGVERKKPFLTGDGRGVSHLVLREPGVFRNRPHIRSDGQGVSHHGLREPGVVRNRPELPSNGRGVTHAALREPGVGDEPIYHPTTMPKLRQWFALLSARLRHVRILNGDWSRLCTHGATHTLSVSNGDGAAGVFLDPPYGNEGRAGGLYSKDDGSIIHAVREWALANGGDRKMRIVLAGFDTEHAELEAHGWRVHEWFVQGFLRGGLGDQQHKERVWSSPHCIRSEKAQAELMFLGPDERFCGEGPGRAELGEQQDDLVS